MVEDPKSIYCTFHLKIDIFLYSIYYIKILLSAQTTFRNRFSETLLSKILTTESKSLLQFFEDSATDIHKERSINSIIRTVFKNATRNFIAVEIHN